MREDRATTTSPSTARHAAGPVPAGTRDTSLSREPDGKASLCTLSATSLAYASARGGSLPCAVGRQSAKSHARCAAVPRAWAAARAGSMLRRTFRILYFPKPKRVLASLHCLLAFFSPLGSIDFVTACTFRPKKEATFDEPTVILFMNQNSCYKVR